MEIKFNKADEVPHPVNKDKQYLVYIKGQKYPYMIGHHNGNKWTNIPNRVVNIITSWGELNEPGALSPKKTTRKKRVKGEGLTTKTSGDIKK